MTRPPAPTRPAKPEANLTLRQQALLQLDRRAVPGTLSYPLAWFAVVAANPTLREQTTAVVIITVVALSFAVARVWLHRVFGDLVISDAARAEQLLRLLAIGNALVMSVVGVLAVLWPPMQGSRDLILAVGGVVCAAGTMALAIDNVLRVGIPLAILGPFTLGLLVSGELENAALAPLIIVSGIYLIQVSGAVRDDWWRAAQLFADQKHRAHELRRLSITDGLTGLANRIYFDQRLEDAWAHAERSGGIISVLLVDLDHFKAINDTFGHATGDRCLEQTAEAIQSCAQRRTDLVARYGGEEFAMLLPGTASPAALVLAEDVRAAIEGVHVELDGEPIPLSASVGVATLAPMRTGVNADGLVAAADAALYGAKRAGRNRVEAAVPA